MKNSHHTIRPCAEKDLGTLLKLIKELAAFGNDLHLVKSTEADLHRFFFAPHPIAQALVAEVSGEVVGYAVFHPTTSTYAGKLGLFLEDLYVSPEHRSKGLGTALFMRVVELAKQNDYIRIDWKAYKWNEEAIKFYLSLGAVANATHTQYRLNDQAIEALSVNPANT